MNDIIVRRDETPWRDHFSIPCEEITYRIRKNSSEVIYAFTKDISNFVGPFKLHSAQYFEIVLIIDAIGRISPDGKPYRENSWKTLASSGNFPYGSLMEEVFYPWPEDLIQITSVVGIHSGLILNLVLLPIDTSRGGLLFNKGLFDE